MVAARALAASVRADCSFWRCSSRAQPRQCACGGAPLGSWRKRGEWAQAVGRSRGGRTSKIHCLADDSGRPVAFALTPGNVTDISMAMPLLAVVARPDRITDKAYDADNLRDWLKIRRIEAVFLTRSIAPSIDVATLSSVSSAVSRTRDGPPRQKLSSRTRSRRRRHRVDLNESST
jgi:hypothetical protein